ncbi:caffeine resistance protein [Coleophoma cylindrospora]|uniref:Caffeine resistance protein n=1 Tax=Coleophoma cylindrospora TaxID=1849047 RepID=A0A3D8RLB7_9HELO|nr:caffeine resistance protein [Coleophoma cylindrospora]
MNNHFRDTVFGQVVRLFSRNRHFRFPDELDPTLWKQCVHGNSAASSSTVGESYDRAESRDQTAAVNVSDGGEKGLKPEAPTARTNGSGDVQTLDQGDSGHEKPTGVRLVDWYGPNDQENPQNWSAGRKLLVTFQICVLNFGIYIGSSIYTPGELSIIKEFGVSEVVATLGLSLFVLGYGLGPMLFSPMSEMPTIGRSRIYFWTLFTFVLLQLPTGYAVNIAMLLVFRFLTGFFRGPVLATGGATIIDMYPPIEVPQWISIFGACGVLGPVLGPLVGGFAAQAKGWRWTIWELAWLGAGVLMVLFFLLPETSSENILYWRAQRMRKATGDLTLKSQSEIDAEKVDAAKDSLIMLGRAFTLTFSEPVIFFVDLYSALLYGVLYIWFGSFPLVFGDIYGFNIGQQGLVFLGIFVGGLITVPCYLFWIRRYLVPQFSKPPIQPEIILPPTFFGAFALPICLFWYGWTSRADIHWIVPLIGSGSFTISIITLFMPVLTYLGMAYPQYPASVLAGNALFRASCGVVFPLFARALFRNLGIGPGNSLLGGLAILFIPIPFILFYYGGQIRHRSKNATHV